jgi:preprotein translocase subunit SecD
MVLDGKVISAPTVNSLDLPKNPQGFVITGNFNHKTASELALQLRYGALPVEFQPATLETVSATLGSSSLHAGIVAGIVGLAAVALYMLLFYRLLGLVAILSLATSTGLLWTIISYLGAHNGLALTLAGITGIIVSIGVAVDSNVVFYEHLREDMTKGRTLRSTVNHSFDTAWRTIVSADFVSLIGAVILYLLTVGSVRGFAFYLGLSTLIDLIASWFFMRPLVFWLASMDRFNERPGLLGVKPHRSGSQGLGATTTAEVGA